MARLLRLEDLYAARGIDVVRVGRASININGTFIPKFFARVTYSDGSNKTILDDTRVAVLRRIFAQ